MKTVLSVRDFAILYNMANEKIMEMEKRVRNVFWSFGCDDKRTDEQKEKEAENSMKMLQQDPYYQDLLRIRDKLGELNIEVETPSVEVEE